MNLPSTCRALLVACAFASSAIQAETCYDVSGSVATTNVSPLVQTGEIDLTLSNETSVIFHKTGAIVGTITGTDGFGNYLLSHTVKFPLLDSFVTRQDSVVMVSPYVRDTEVDGSVCSFYIHETSSHLLVTAGFFSGLSHYEMYADGYVSNCLADNHNEFTLSGTVCLE